MKDGIHPTYHPAVTVQCSCGNSWETGSTESSLTVEVCSACHPFYTGKRKLVDVAGRIDRFKKRLEAASSRKVSAPRSSSRSRKRSSQASKTRRIKG